MSFESASEELALIASVICSETDAACELVTADESLLGASLAAGITQIALVLTPLRLLCLDEELAANSLAKS